MSGNPNEAATPGGNDAPIDAQARHDARHRILGFLVARGVKGRGERERWLNRLLDEVQADDATVFGSPQATVRAIDAYERLTDADNPADASGSDVDSGCTSWLPAETPRPMPRQPLGDLPAVLTGSFWYRTTQWARLRRRQASSAAAETD